MDGESRQANGWFPLAGTTRHLALTDVDATGPER
jgi:hypothetical protein